MKTRTILIAIAFLFIGSNTQAQFFKKLGKSVEKAAERVVTKKVEQKATKETEKAMDTVLGNSKQRKRNTKKNESSDVSDSSDNRTDRALNIGGFGNQIDPSILPKSYNYDWRYTLQMKHEKGTMDMHYHLRKNGTDFASKIEMEQRSPMGGMLMVMDAERGIMAMLMEMNGSKTGQLTEMNTNEIEAAVSDADMNDYEIKEIGTKTILGNTCQGYQMENEDMKTTMYVALNTPVSLNAIQDPKKMPKGFDPKWFDKIGENNLMMEMQMVHKKKKKHSATITCVALEKEPLTINISEYKFGF